MRLEKKKQLQDFFAAKLAKEPSVAPSGSCLATGCSAGRTICDGWTTSWRRSKSTGDVGHAPPLFCCFLVWSEEEEWFRSLDRRLRRGCFVGVNHSRRLQSWCLSGVFIGGRGVGPLRLVHSGSQSAGSRPKQGSKMGPRRGDPNLSCIFPTLPLLVCDCL